MTDEEKLAEEYVKGRGFEHYHFIFEENSGTPADFAKLCYLDGLKAGRDIEKEYVKNNAFTSMKEQGLFPFGKWHKVAAGDYPPCEKGNYTINVLTDCGDIAYYDYDMDCWIVEPSSAEIDPPIAWCEIPKFEE